MSDDTEQMPDIGEDEAGHSAAPQEEMNFFRRLMSSCSFW